jgi:hypothetical protein
MEVTPLELKLSIESLIATDNGKVSYEKENECCICMTSLFEDLESKSMEEIVAE